jgi:small subunit ribosomal protein S5
MTDKVVAKKIEKSPGHTKKHGARKPHERRSRAPPVQEWIPKTKLGSDVKEGKITSLNYIFDHQLKIVEPEIVDHLLPELGNELLLIGQSKGKFGGGAKRIFRQTQKKTAEGNKPSFATSAVIGNYNGLIGIGFGKSKDTVPAREKAKRNAKRNIFRIRRGCGSWRCSCGTPHSIPYTVEGKCGSVKIKLMPAPKGNGLVVEKECAKILKLAGFKDVWAKTSGQTKVKHNLITACERALRKLNEVKVREDFVKKAGIVEGYIIQ